jgi:thiamine-phosphate pyrophosphorylase
LASKPAPPRPAPRLYLATPELDDPSALIASLPGLLAGADIAAVLVRLKPTDQRTMISRVKALAPAIQGGGAALLLDGHVELVARAGADGAHLTGIEAMAEALPSLKPDRIAGVGGLSTRHDSMAAGEAGADYALFGEPDAQGMRPAVEAIAERLEWWAEFGLLASAMRRRSTKPANLPRRRDLPGGEFVWADPRRGGTLETPKRPSGTSRVSESQSRTDNAGNEDPASAVDPASCLLCRRHGADLADAAGAQPPPAATRPPASRSRRRPKCSAATPKPGTPAHGDRDARSRSRIRTSTWSTAPISAASTRPRSIWRPTARSSTAIPRP